MKKYILLIISVLLIDLILSSLILKKTKFWVNSSWENKWWRISSQVYHHKILPNIKKKEKWGGKIERELITNSIGFRDKEVRKIEKVNLDKKRILLIGDSFIEGVGLNYENTISGLLDEYLKDDYEVLNSAVGSYSPSIYYKKTKHYLDQGYKFDQALIFLDVSDVFDELFIKFNADGEILTYEETKQRSVPKKLFYATGKILRDNFSIFRFVYMLSDRTEIIKNYIKLKLKTSKELNKSFFNTTRDEVMFYRMTHIDRGFWTYNVEKFSKISKGLEQSEKYLIKLFNLLNKNNVKSTLIIYPWPTQIFYGDNYHEKHWKKFAQINKINFLSTYNVFKSEDNKQFIFDNFIYGDVHWNNKGTKIIFEELLKRIKFF